ncbi:TetR/AcrR family transcriptional regulator, partial [Mycolicibacterium farcinogenes]|nr:TetR/AcrR family transcriptional regulator [Mycolicibacterium farcinogenes]
ASKQDLLDAFAVWERKYYEQAVAQASAGLPDDEHLDAALRTVARCRRRW